MRKFLRSCLINSICLALLAELFPGFQIIERLKGIVLAGLGLTVIDLIVKPVIKTILLPITLLTLGTLRWIINVISLALLALSIPQVTIKSFHFDGFNFGGIIIQPFRVSLLLSVIFSSLILTLIKKALQEIIKKPSSE